jgi:hypothetical protein
MDLLALVNESRRYLYHLKRLLAVSLVLLPSIGHAGIDVDDLMSIAWEGLWNQSGSPAPLRKWNQPLRVRVSGDIDSLQKKTINEGLSEITQATGLEYSVLDPNDNTENVLIEVVLDSPKLGPTTPCSTRMEWSSNGMKKATVTAKMTSVYQCVLHELGHVVGIEGHPYGRTIMTYFNRRNELSDYDKFILKVRYSPEAKHGTLPFRVLKMIGDKYVASLASENERMQAQQSIDKFMASVLHSMGQYAEGKGEPPLVIFRSGRISKQSMEAGRIPMRYYLGEALLEGDLGVVDPARATEWLQQAAANKYQPAAWSLAWRYQNGKGLERDSVHAYSWYAYAASLGSQNAKKRQTQIEETVAASELPAYQEAAAELQAKLGEQATRQGVTTAQ